METKGTEPKVTTAEFFTAQPVKPQVVKVDDAGDRELANPGQDPSLGWRDNAEVRFEQILREKAQAEKDELLRARGVTPGKVRPFEEFDQVPITFEFLASIWARTKTTAATKPERDTLKAALVETTRLREVQRGYGNDREREFLDRARATRKAEILAGNPNPKPLPTYEEIYDILKDARAEIEGQIRAENLKVVPLLEAIRGRLLGAAEKLADQIQGDEILAHEANDGKFGWPYVPSQTVVTLRQLPWRHAKIHPGGFHLNLELEKLGVRL